MKKLLRETRVCSNKECQNTFVIIITSKQKYCSNRCGRIGKSSGAKGKPAWSRNLTKETDTRIIQMAENLSKSKKGKPCWFKGLTYDEAFGKSKAKILCKRSSITMKRTHQQGKIYAWNKGLTKETDERVAKSSRATSEGVIRLWQTPEYVAKQMKARNVYPNKLEMLLNSILQELFPNEYKYVGDGEFILAGKCPDFINVNDQKKIIELYGDYWHRNDNPQKRIDLFARYGYQTLIIWEHELNDIKKLKEKLLGFSNVL